MNTTPSPYKEALQKTGLNTNEADLYLYLLEHGKTNISQLLSDTGLKRGNLYHILYSLRDQGLVAQSEEKKKLHFELNDPTTLRPLLERQRQQVQDNLRQVEEILPSLSSTYTLTSHKPGIVLFEGEDAMRRVLDDSLTAQDTILQYIDLKTLIHAYPDLNKTHNRQRTKLQKKKCIILPDTPLSREYAATQKPAITEIRLIKHPLPRFHSVMLMYDNKISYLTLRPKGMIGAIIEDDHIAQLHRGFFEFIWSIAEPAPQ